jgi:xanthine dehydrogenase large subunit
MHVGGQDHLYLEGQIAFAIPGEDEDVVCIPRPSTRARRSTWSPTCSACPPHSVTVNVRRMGGGFGGKETQMNHFAAVAALAAKKWNRAVKIRPDRDDDMTMTGKRHDFVIDYEVGPSTTRAGSRRSTSTSPRAAAFLRPLRPGHRPRAVPRRQRLFLSGVRLTLAPLKTNTVSNTAFRGFGGPQGMIAAERMSSRRSPMRSGKDPLDVRKANFYGGPGRDVTPYHQDVEDNIIDRHGE